MDNTLIIFFFTIVIGLTSCDFNSHQKEVKKKQQELKTLQDSVKLLKNKIAEQKNLEPQTPNSKLPKPLPDQLKFSQTNITLSDTSFQLTHPENWKISVAQEGFGRLRFLAKSPDNRLFVTDMKNRTDNSKGKVFILKEFNKESATFDTCITYMENLRNPNNLVFHADTNGVEWLYLALTQKLVRFKYAHGETSPTAQEEVIATFPDYGLSYKYGGWHLTRTVAIHDEKLYVSVGSSCNACEEKEPERASILEMNLDGKNVSHYAYGVRNAVDINWIHNQLYSTNMGADHLGDEAPDEALYRLERGKHYGWPYYYQYDGKILKDASQDWRYDSLKAENVPLALAELGGHSAPLGFEFFEGENWPTSVRNYFLVALHGSGKVRIGNGYNIVRVVEGKEPEPIIYGWLKDGHRFGRPTDVFIYDENSFFITDDHRGVLYFVEVK